MADPEPTLPTPEPLWRSHLALLVSSLVIGSVILRILGATKGDLNATFAILDAADPVKVGTGSLVSLLVLLGPIGTAGFAYFMWRMHRLRGSVPAACQATFAVFVLPVVTLTPWTYVVIGVVGFGLLAWRRVRQDKNGPPGTDDSDDGLSDGTLLAFAVLGLSMLGIFALPPWWPSEALELQDGTSVVGYVFAGEGEELVVLDEETRTVRRVPTSSVRSREYCSTSNALDEVPSLMELAQADESYPRCPSP